jgi:leucyl aminopeptidase
MNASKTLTLEARPSLGKAADTDIVIVYQDASKKAIAPKGPYGQTALKLKKADVHFGRSGSAHFIRFGGKGGAESALWVSLGNPADLTEEKIRLAGGSAWAKLVAEKSKAACVRVEMIANSKLPEKITTLAAIRAFAEGLVLGAYQFKKHKSKEGDGYAGPDRISFVCKDKKLMGEVKDVLSEVEAERLAVSLTRDWSNEPSNIGTPEFFAEDAQRLAKEYGLKCTVLTEKDAEKEKMGLFLGVGQGAEREGRVVIVEYNPKGGPKNVKAQKTLALVGKGVTFDSGGISIKPSMRMEDMKHDMTGAATVMGAIILASLWKVPTRVVAIMAFTENMPSGSAIQPGNVLTSRAGKTVEVINTDAEGRLILADVLDYAQDLKPDAIVDVATLTGAVSIALGKMCCAVLGNDEGLIESVRKAGTVKGERIWQLPLFDEYFEDLKSDYADMKNSANDSYGGTIRGAIFLKQFIRKGVPWAHLDIAATAWGLTHLSYYPKRGASGAYVRTLAQLAKDF